MIFIEGLPGSGKTTFARRLHDGLKAKGVKVKAYSEGALNPIDLAWCALLDEATFEAFKKKYPFLEKSMDAVSMRRSDYVIVPFLQLDRKHLDQSIIKDFERYEIYNTNDLSPFKEAHLKLWKAFEKEADLNTVYIFECVFFQNHINELILKYNLTLPEQVEYFKDLLNSIKKLNPVIYHVSQADVDRTLSNIIEKRRSPDKTKYPDWIDLMVEHLNRHPYSKRLGFEGERGVYEYFKHRQGLESEILCHLEGSHHSFVLRNDYDRLFDSIEAVTNAWIGETPPDNTLKTG